LTHRFRGFISQWLCCFWACVKQNIMVGAQDGADLNTSWCLGSTRIGLRAKHPPHSKTLVTRFL
jgi:hypothetical protein